MQVRHETPCQEAAQFCNGPGNCRDGSGLGMPSGLIFITKAFEEGQPKRWAYARKYGPLVPQAIGTVRATGRPTDTGTPAPKESTINMGVEERGASPQG